jgi:muconolactone delta-isomerase
MKYIGFWEYAPGSLMKVIEKFKQMTMEREKGNKDFAKLILGPFRLFGESKGFSIFETDDPEKLTEIANFYIPEMKWNFIPIHDAAEYIKPTMADIYLRKK